jgi:hypothetical protein
VCKSFVRMTLIIVQDLMWVVIRFMAQRKTKHTRWAANGSDFPERLSGWNVQCEVVRRRASAFETSKHPSSEISGTSNPELQNSNRVLLAYRALHAPRSVAVADFRTF